MSRDLERTVERLAGVRVEPAAVSWASVDSDAEFNQVNGSTPIQGGTYSISVDVSTWPSGNVDVWTAFDPTDADQPAAAIGRYGRLGERLTGPNVTVNGPYRRVEQEITLQLRGLN